MPFMTLELKKVKDSLQSGRFSYYRVWDKIWKVMLAFRTEHNLGISRTKLTAIISFYWAHNGCHIHLTVTALHSTKVCKVFWDNLNTTNIMWNVTLLLAAVPYHKTPFSWLKPWERKLRKVLPHPVKLRWLDLGFKISAEHFLDMELCVLTYPTQK